MRRWVVWLFLLASLAAPGWVRPAQAQAGVTTLERLEVEIWPDFDREAALVLMTGQLPASTVLPASVTLPLPPGVTFNVAARISPDEVMSDDINYDLSAEQVTLVTPDSRFRVEYYLPYNLNGSERRFSFSWQNGPAVDEFLLRVQQPPSAPELVLSPVQVSISPGMFGLNYYNMPATTLAANETFTLEVRYSLGREELTADSLPPADSASAPAAAPQAAAPAPAVSASPGFSPALLAVIGGAVLLLAGLGWWAIGSGKLPAFRRTPTAPPPALRPASPRRRGKPGPAKAGAAVAFCPECGQPSDPNDKFCRYCGTALGPAANA